MVTDRDGCGFPRLPKSDEHDRIVAELSRILAAAKDDADNGELFLEEPDDDCN